MEYYKKKLEKLIEHSVSTFQSKNNQVHVEGRSAAEALCKLMILKHYGEEEGSNVIYNNNNRQGEAHRVELSKLINICIYDRPPIIQSCYEDNYTNNELSNVVKETRTYVKSHLLALNNRGNSLAHESYRRPLYAETTQNLLREILEWLFQDFLKIEIPHELTSYIGTYDIFISYSKKDEVWVEALKENLHLHGYKLIDNYQCIAGENKEKSLINAIERSKKAIIIYPEKNDESREIQNGLEWIRDKKDQNSKFTIIPIVIHNSNNLSHERIQDIDFSGQDYQEAFNQLLCSLEDVPPLQNLIKHELVLPNTSNQFVNEVIQDLELEKVIILFSQEFSNIKKYYKPIKKELKRKFSKQFYELSIPSYKKKKYFNFLAESCGVNEHVETLQEWKTAMQEKLSTGEETLLFITDLENGKEECNQQLASTLRSLSYQFSDNLYIVLVGHKSLAKLVFQEHNLSPLRSVGKYLFFPYDNTQLLYDSIRLVLSDPIVEKYKELICKLLEKEKVERFLPWSHIPIINYLFWQGILIRKGNHVRWRDEKVKEMIKEICKNKKNQLK